MRTRILESILLTATLLVPACGDDGGSGGGTNDGETSTPTTTGNPPETTGDDPTGDGPAETTTGNPSDPDSSGSDSDATETGQAADCTDQMTLDLGLVDGTVSEGNVTNMADGDGWASVVDATAGGIANAATNPWIYLRFTAEGLERVDVDDLQALDSSDWDIAAKRFGVRLNSGVSGPSTVAAALIDGVAYDDVDAAPDAGQFGQEAFYDADCNLIDDGSGQGAPNYVLTPWWFYPGCVGTTQAPFVLELADGSHVKFVIDAYYESGQDGCNMGGTMGMGSAMFSWRWAYL